jgi:hypothetical protein
MKQFITLLILVFSINNAFSQAPENIANGHQYGSFEVGDTSFTLVADANVRDKANTSGAVVAKLAIGTPLKIDKVTTDSLTIKGVRLPWYRVSFVVGKERKSGFLWGGFIASVFYSDIDYNTNETYLYLGGIAAYDDKKVKVTDQLRVAKNGQQIAALEFQSCADIGYYPMLEFHSSNGFDNVRQVLTYGTHYGACDYPQGDYLLVLTKNNQLQKIMETSSASGAGTGYSSETYILPSHRGGIHSHILVTEDSAAEEEDKNGEYKIKDQKYKIALWKWTGSKLIKVQ